MAETGQSGSSVPWKTILDLDFQVSIQLGISATRVTFGPSSVFYFRTLSVPLGEINVIIIVQLSL